MRIDAARGRKCREQIEGSRVRCAALRLPQQRRNDSHAHMHPMFHLSPNGAPRITIQFRTELVDAGQGVQDAQRRPGVQAREQLGCDDEAVFDGVVLRQGSETLLLNASHWATTTAHTAKLKSTESVEAPRVAPQMPCPLTVKHIGLSHNFLQALMLLEFDASLLQTI